LDFTDISVSAKTADIVSASVGVNETLLFLMHPDNLRKKAQWSKSRQLSYSNVSRCSFI